MNKQLELNPSYAVSAEARLDYYLKLKEKIERDRVRIQAQKVSLFRRLDALEARLQALSKLEKSSS